MTIYLVAACVALGLFAVVGLLVVSIVGNPTAAGIRLAEVTSVRAEKKTHYSLRDIFAYVGRPLGQIRKVVGLKGDDDLAYRLSVAGYREPHDIDTFLDTKLLMPVMGVLVGTFAGGSNMLLACLLLGAGCFFAPDFFLIQAMKKRKTAIGRSLPDALDLLVICIEAGLGLDQAVLRVAQEFQPVSPELSAELTIVCHEQRAGKPRTEAWHSLADRVDLDTIRHFAGMLTQSERLGTPIARALSQFADSLRTKRIMQAEEQAAKTPVKLLFPLVFCIFPAMFVVILGPAGLMLTKALDSSPHH